MPSYHTDSPLVRHAPMIHQAYIYHERTVIGTARLGALRLHDLRHSCASLLIASGQPLKVVSERLGHSNIGITADVYGHVYAAQDQAATAIDALLTKAPTLRQAT
jgi:integrase